MNTGPYWEVLLGNTKIFLFNPVHKKTWNSYFLSLWPRLLRNFNKGENSAEREKRGQRPAFFPNKKIKPWILGIQKCWGGGWGGETVCVSVCEILTVIVFENQALPSLLHFLIFLLQKNIWYDCLSNRLHGFVSR